MLFINSKDFPVLQKTVLLSYCDIAAAGSRVLLGIPGSLLSPTLLPPDLDGLRPACELEGLDSAEHFAQPIAISHWKEISVVVINTVVVSEKCHCLVNYIMDLIVNSNVEKIILLSALHLDSSDQDAFENTFDSEPVTPFKPLPPSTLIKDVLLSTFLQMIQIEGIPCSCLLVPGHKARFEKPNPNDGSEQVIFRFQNILKRAMFGTATLEFKEEITSNLVFRGKNSPDDDMATMMYA